MDVVELQGEIVEFDYFVNGLTESFFILNELKSLHLYFLSSVALIQMSQPGILEGKHGVEVLLLGQGDGVFLEEGGGGELGEVVLVAGVEEVQGDVEVREV